MFFIFQSCANTDMNANNQKITVCGTAKHVKIGAVVVLDNGGFYYVDGLHSWGDLTDHKVCVTGELKIVEVEPVKTIDGELIEQGFSEKATLLIIKNAKWELVE